MIFHYYEVYSKIWNAFAPSKVMALGWRIMRRRLPTLDNLARRGVIQDLRTNGICKFCRKEMETVDHLFFECNFSYDIWRLCLLWLGACGPLPNHCSIHLLAFESWGGPKRWKKAWRSIWFVGIWSLWIHRNVVFFKGIQPDREEVLESINAFLGFG